jgi:hypothetical protein
MCEETYKGYIGTNQSVTHTCRYAYTCTERCTVDVIFFFGSLLGVTTIDNMRIWPATKLSGCRLTKLHHVGMQPRRS